MTSEVTKENGLAGVKASGRRVGVTELWSVAKGQDFAFNAWFFPEPVQDRKTERSVRVAASVVGWSTNAIGSSTDKMFTPASGRGHREGRKKIVQRSRTQTV